VFRAAADGSVHACCFKLLLQQRADFADVAFPIHAAPRQALGDVVILIRIQLPKGQILQLPLEVPDAEPIGERRKDFLRLKRQALLFGARQLPHVAQPDQCLGQARYDQAWIGGHGQQHLAQGLGLLRIQALALRPAWWQAECPQVSEFGRQLRGGDAEAPGHRLSWQQRARGAHVRDPGGDRELCVFGQRCHEFSDFRSGRARRLGDLQLDQARAGLLKCGSGAVQGMLDSFHGSVQWGWMGVWARTLPAIIQGMVEHSKGWHAPLSAQRLAHLPA
jgi:hypothetical protein